MRFARPGLVEEYSAGTDGVRQDFVVVERPAGTGELVVWLAANGADIEPARYGARLVLRRSGRKLAYGRLRVTDANGTDLPAWMEPGPGCSDGGRETAAARTLAVVVNDSQAVYPVRIDPTFSDENWISMAAIPGMDREVFAAAADGSGNLYIGGNFRLAGDVRADGIAKWDGSHWSALGSGIGTSYPAPPPGVYALAIAGTDVYAAGNFDRAGDVAANGIAKWNGTVWSAMGPEMNGPVYALATSGDTLYAGGNFTTAGGSAAHGVARWNGSTWSALGTGLDGSVNALAAADIYLYAGGSFTNADGGGAANVARWDGTQWSPLGPGLDGTVSALAISGSTVYAGGRFLVAGNNLVQQVARWNGSTWSVLGSGLGSAPGTVPGVDALAALGDDLYAGGYFTTAGGSPALFIAKWNGTAWSAMGAGTQFIVSALAVSGDSLYVCGGFLSAGGIGVRGVAQWKDGTWSALGPGLNTGVSVLATSGTDVYAGGAFLTANGSTANYVAKLSGTNWSALSSGLDNQVNALAVSASNVYAGGYFRAAGGNPAGGIAKWDGTQWSALGSGVDGTQPYVSAIAVSGTNLYAGGYFTSAGGNPADYIAQWNGNRWSALGSGIGGTPGGENPAVFALAVLGGDLYAGGRFSEAGGNPAGDIAKWDGNSWSALGSGMGAGDFWPYVSALAVSGRDLYAAGRFTTADGVWATNIAKWDGTHWWALGSGIGGIYTWVSSLAVSGTNIYAGGVFATAGGNAANFIARWDGTSWSALGSGMNGEVTAISVSGNDLYAGGSFTTAGGKVSAGIARAYLLPLPSLSVVPSGSGIGISWPSLDADGFALEFTGTLANPRSWTATIAPVTQDGPVKSVSIPATNGPQYFRLRKP